jgi:hypothetical protein
MATTWKLLAVEGKTFSLTAPATVRYGAGTTWANKSLPVGTYTCDNGLFGDPLFGVVKACELAVVTVDPPPPPAPPPPLTPATTITRVTLKAGATTLTPDMLNKPVIVSNGGVDCALTIPSFASLGWSRSATAPQELFVCLQHTGTGAFSVTWPLGTYTLTPKQTVGLITDGTDDWMVY